MIALSKNGTTVFPNHTARREKEKELHQLRLRLKAIRVQCFLLEFVYPKRYLSKSLFTPFREYYQQTSRLRDLTVALHRFRKICRKHRLPSNGFQNYLWQHYREEEKHLQRLPIPDIAAFEQQYRNELPTEELTNIVTQQLQQVMEKVLAAHMDPEKSGNLHWQRKQLKKLIYLNQLLPEERSVWDESITTKLEILDEKLGAWHDLQVLLQFIGRFAGQHSRGHTPAWLPRIARAVITEQVRILESLKELTK
ncbi:CHAD domain-containing protein [Prolixibacter sp. NT017]|uniref:CHAD domain-containing protein n=1 Tax=Prolixibacter sp. NT017 TaxID=2652390 RepID=UPI001276FB02|nr:CHAD domain-containing protein [Prolixibacter sp. NT017]GET27456.1 hypothetical protein NT017_37850 [Prolixibacter sp. NT017]